MKYLLLGLTLFGAISCNQKKENALQLAIDFCDCMQKHQTQNGKMIRSGFCDSAVLGRNRFMQIKYAGKQQQFSIETIDSAVQFDREFTAILDSLCFSKKK